MSNQHDTSPKLEGEGVIDLLWDSLKRDPEHADRRQTGWGTKTKVGLIACVHRLYAGVPCDSCGCLPHND